MEWARSLFLLLGRGGFLSVVCGWDNETKKPAQKARSLFLLLGWGGFLGVVCGWDSGTKKPAPTEVI